MGYTKGPWKFEESTKTIRSTPQNYWLATMDSWDGAIDNKANAHLIASAPDLLETARALIIDLMTKCEPIEGSSHNFEKSRMYVSHVLNHRIGAVQQAIAKAEGGK